MAAISVKRSSRFQAVVPMTTIIRDSRFFCASAIDKRMPSRVFCASAIEKQLPSRVNTSKRVELRFASRIQSVSTFSSLRFSSSFLSSTLVPEIGVDSIGNLQFTITPENPLAVQS